MLLCEAFVQGTMSANAFWTRTAAPALDAVSLHHPSILIWKTTEGKAMEKTENEQTFTQKSSSIHFLNFNSSSWIEATASSAVHVRVCVSEEFTSLTATSCGTSCDFNVSKKLIDISNGRQKAHSVTSNWMARAKWIHWNAPFQLSAICTGPMQSNSAGCNMAYDFM